MQVPHTFFSLTIYSESSILIHLSFPFSHVSFEESWVRDDAIIAIISWPIVNRNDRESFSTPFVLGNRHAAHPVQGAVTQSPSPGPKLGYLRLRSGRYEWLVTTAETPAPAPKTWATKLNQLWSAGLPVHFPDISPQSRSSRNSRNSRHLRINK